MYYKRPQWVSNISVYIYIYIHLSGTSSVYFLFNWFGLYIYGSPTQAGHYAPLHIVIFKWDHMTYSECTRKYLLQTYAFWLGEFSRLPKFSRLKTLKKISLLVTKMLHYDSQAKAFMSDEYDTIWLVIKCHSDLMT